MCGECVWERGLQVKKARLKDCEHLKGLVVVIDVIRAFTTAAYAFAAGAKKIMTTATVEEAWEMKRHYPEALLIGESDGMQIQGFDLDNSPITLKGWDLKGKTLIFRTSSGTQGIARSRKAERMLVSSFVVAEATLRRIRKLGPYQFTCVITGQTRGGFEDEALADYLDDKIRHGSVDAEAYLTRVKESPSGKMFLSGEIPHFTAADLAACCKLDQFDFAMEVFKEDGVQVIRPVDENGSLINNG